jgi:hypothetical protein
MGRIEERKKKLLERNKATYAGMTDKEQRDHFAAAVAATKAKKAANRASSPANQQPKEPPAPDFDLPCQPAGWGVAVARHCLLMPGRSVRYAAYLRTAHWRQVLARKLEAVGGKCERCGRDWRVMVAHRHCDTLYAEANADLEATCGACRRDQARREKARR